MVRLGVNIDHCATLREARYRGIPNGEPDPIDAALASVAAGCHGITAHLREDRRHLQDHDIERLAKVLSVPLNFEMANTPEMLEVALNCMPAAVCMVPENRLEVTTEGGLDVEGQHKAITASVTRLQGEGIEVSLFVDPDAGIISASKQTGAHAIELHTGAYAAVASCDKARGIELERLRASSELANSLGLKVNAGHGLNYDNIRFLHEIPWLHELNIGHSIVSRALFVGFEKAVKEMLDLVSTEGQNQPLGK
jgi:pyridoxine 5-phosphate synthase